LTYDCSDEKKTGEKSSGKLPANEMNGVSNHLRMTDRLY
jgi:hypothetical protein